MGKNSIIIRSYLNDSLEQELKFSGEQTHLKIGRKSKHDSDLTFSVFDPENKISRKHGIIHIDKKDSVRYTDLSSNGTFVDGVIVKGEKIELKDGSELSFGNHLNYKITVEFEKDIHQMDSPVKTSFVEGDDKIINLNLEEFKEYDEVIIGRAPENIISLSSLTVSRYHPYNSNHQVCGLP